MAFLPILCWNAAAEESSPGAGTVPSRVLQWGVQGALPNWENLRESRERQRAPATRVTDAGRTWVGPGAAAAKPSHTYRSSPWEALGDQECCHQGRWHRRALQPCQLGQELWYPPGTEPRTLSAAPTTADRAARAELKGTRCPPRAGCRLGPALAPASSSSSGHSSPGRGNPPLSARAAGGGEQVEEYQ